MRPASRVIRILAVAALALFAFEAPSSPLPPPPPQQRTRLSGRGARAAGGTDDAASAPRVTLVVRTFVGDAERFSRVLLPTLLAFVDWRACAVVLLLDDDGASRAWAPELAAALPRARVAFAAAPPDSVLTAAPFASMEGHSRTSRYAERGYTRQLYDTFFLDELVWPAAGGSANAGKGEARGDVVALIDSDAQLFGVFPPRAIFAPGRLRQRGLPVVVKPGDFFRGDELLLRGPTQFDSMTTERMPELFWRETFAQLRAHVAQMHGEASFEAVWLRLFGDRSGGDERWLSPANVLANFGLRHDPGGYAPELLGHNETAPALGSNRPGELELAAACCATFDGLGGRCSQRAGSFPEFYESTAAQLGELSEAERGRMEAAAAPLCGV